MELFVRKLFNMKIYCTKYFGHEIFTCQLYIELVPFGTTGQDQIWHQTDSLALAHASHPTS